MNPINMFTREHTGLFRSGTPTGTPVRQNLIRSRDVFGIVPQVKRSDRHNILTNERPVMVSGLSNTNNRRKALEVSRRMRRNIGTIRLIMTSTTSNLFTRNALVDIAKKLIIVEMKGRSNRDARSNGKLGFRVNNSTHCGINLMSDGNHVVLFIRVRVLSGALSGAVVGKTKSVLSTRSIFNPGT